MKIRIPHIILLTLLLTVARFRTEAAEPLRTAPAENVVPAGEPAAETAAGPAAGEKKPEPASGLELVPEPEAASYSEVVSAPEVAPEQEVVLAPDAARTEAGESEEPAGDRTAPAGPEEPAEMNVGAEPVSPRGMRLKRRFLPTSRRIDREINKNRFVFKGETMCGLTLSYGTLSTDDADMFPVFENINLSGNITTVNPFVGYFYRDNRCIGVRFGYTHLAGKLNSLGINLGEQNDLEIDIPWLDLASDRFSFGIFHRSYVPLDEKGRFGAFGEFEVSFSTGENTFAYEAGESHKYTSSENTTVKVWFNPGVAVYAFPNVCATLSFGLGGFKYTHIKQYNEAGEQLGTRNYSKMNFRLNLIDIKIGMTVHLWNKKKGERT